MKKYYFQLLLINDSAPFTFTHHLCTKLNFPRYLICSIQALMSAPNPDDPLDEGIARHWKSNEVDAMNTARQWTAEYAQQG